MTFDDWIDIQTLEFSCGKCGDYIAIFAKQKDRWLWLVAGVADAVPGDRPVLSIDGVTVFHSGSHRSKVYKAVPNEAMV